MPSPEVSTSEPSHTAFPAPQSTDLLAKQVVDLSMQIQAQEMLFALLVQALHPIGLNRSAVDGGSTRRH